MARKRRTGGRLIRLIGQGLAAILAIVFAGAAYIYLTLPDVRSLRTENPETTAFMELRDREARAAGQEPRRQQRWIPYARISSNLTRSVLVTEDSAFWDHDGVDYEQVKESIGLNFDRMEFVRGGSTITQQLAKNLYLSPSKDPIRKLRELIIARRLEAELSKRRILELYLNVIEWGDQVYGAEAAARRYFRKSASTLTAEESRCSPARFATRGCSIPAVRARGCDGCSISFSAGWARKRHQRQPIPQTLPARYRLFCLPKALLPYCLAKSFPRSLRVVGARARAADRPIHADSFGSTITFP